MFNGDAYLATCTLFAFLSIIAPCQSYAEPDIPAESRPKVLFRLPSQPLSKSLLAIATATHHQITFDPTEASSIIAPALSGNYTSTEALTVLLNGTGLTFKSDAASVLILKKRPASIALRPIRVGGTLNTHEAAIGPGVGYVAKYTETGTKTDTPITEIPNSIYVITKQEILDQQAQNINETLRYMPGVYAEAQGTATNGAAAGSLANGTGGIMMRGFAATQYVDGIASRSQSAGETAFVERVEALNGPASVLYGQVGPGGLIATRLKQPTDTPIRNVTVGFGNWGRYESTFDVSDKITKSGNLKYRIAGIGVTQGTQTEYLDYKRVGVLPSVKWDIDDKTSLTLLGEYMYTPADGTDTGYPGVGTLVPGKFGYIPRSRYLGDPSDITSTAHDAAFEYQFSHKFNKMFEFQQTFRYEKSDTNYSYLYLNGNLQNDGETLARGAWKGQGSNGTVGLDNRLIGHISTGNVKHTFVVGMDFRRVSVTQNLLYDASVATAINVWNPVYYVTYPNYSLNGPDDIEWDLIKQTQYQSGIYFQDQIKWKRLSVLLGGRQDWYKYSATATSADNYETDAGHGVITPPYVYDRENPSASKFTWRAGFTYNFDFGLVPYFSYATSFIPQVGSFDANGQAAKPLTGKQFEAGLKYLIPKSDVLLTAAAYHIKENHYQITDADNPGHQVDAGTVTSKGVELSAHANITKDLHLTASYSFNDMRVTKSDTMVDRYDMAGNDLGQVREQGKYVGGLPRNMVNMFVDYTPPARVFQGFGINFGVRYIGFTWAGNGESYKVPAYILFDAGAHYDFGRLSPILKGLTGQLAMSNLANTRYVGSCGTGVGGGTCYYGQGRRVYGNLSYSW
ncbi:TonB-dependent siderophore receptor [Acetobacter senegalensis]|uniref:TonB-dependent siderophore receptor n=1 Tax=Acetobacter senegalensis TaxID=446692 RepID=UPI00209D22FF|nr:TonB-dependent siderophore receptor [Acetobacter senegalensis]MCP1197690.1 TonB-dependent siderophore receptor [Acetobacter senegalensis]